VGLLERERSVDHHEHDDCAGGDVDDGRRVVDERRCGTRRPGTRKTIFAANCASCHGATGTEGGVGPSLKNEKSRRTTIRRSRGSTIDAADAEAVAVAAQRQRRANVAAYVQSL